MSHVYPPPCGTVIPSYELLYLNTTRYVPPEARGCDDGAENLLNIQNDPIASILSFAMALRYSLDLDKEADALEKAVQDVLNDGLRTKDILSEGMKETSTSEMGDAIISKLQ